jgi:hypothetical protein
MHVREHMCANKTKNARTAKKYLPVCTNSPVFFPVLLSETVLLSWQLKRKEQVCAVNQKCMSAETCVKNENSEKVFARVHKLSCHDFFFCVALRNSVTKLAA